MKRPRITSFGYRQFKGTEKKHNTADTSISAYRILKQSGQLDRERIKVFAAICQHQPCTSRMLVKITGLERGNITRAIYDLENAEQPQIKVAFKDKCPVTNIRVKYYSTLNWVKNERE